MNTRTKKVRRRPVGLRDFHKSMATVMRTNQLIIMQCMTCETRLTAEQVESDACANCGSSHGDWGVRMLTKDEC